MEKEKWVRRRRKECLPFEEERRRIRDLIGDFLNGLKKIKNKFIASKWDEIKNEFIASKWDDIEVLRMELRFLKTFVLFGNSNLDGFHYKIDHNIEKFHYLFNEDEFFLAKYNMDSLTPYLLKEIKSYLRLENVAIMTEENMFVYRDSLLKNLHDLPKYSSDLLLPLMSEYKILRQVCRLLRDFYVLECNKITTTEFLYARYQMTVDRVTQLCFDLWTGKYKNYTFFDMYAIYRCSSEITFLLIDIIPLELEVLYICTSKLIKESRSKELERCVKQILKASPRILQNYLILLQQGMAGALAVNYAPTQTINVMIEFLLIFLTDIPKRFNSILVRDKSLSHLIFSLPNVIDKINLIVAQVTSLQLEDNNEDHLLDAKSSEETIESTSSSFVEVTVGHEEEEAWIICQLLDEHESELDVISIVGMPGLGKTTLANKVYKNTLVATHFNVRAWCTVSQKYNKSKVLREILQQVTVSEKKESEDDLAENLRRALLDKRYLIVLDDVWDIETRELLIGCFPKVKRGNRIILTSRSSKVGLQVKCHSDPLHLQLLTPEKSWDLFVKKVFGDEGSCPAELSEVGHQIVEKCKGLPLAIVLIAGVIVRGKKKEKDLWLQIEHNLDSFISSNNNLQMMKVMQLSYDHLPYHLKPLLLYFARSEKNKRTPVSTLMQLWMAEGLVDHDSSEEVTQSYLDALIPSSLIMVDHIPSESVLMMSAMIKVIHFMLQISYTIV
ncbi:hypothetical protein KY285_019344 [Solanum tuberosum]|nr:hypothetical protein KY285_019344 [Solanum tuberosum]